MVIAVGAQTGDGDADMRNRLNKASPVDNDKSPSLGRKFSGETLEVNDPDREAEIVNTPTRVKADILKAK